MPVEKQDLEQILEEPISRRSFFRKSAAGFLLLEEAIRNSGCTQTFIAKPIIYPTGASCPPIRSDYGDWGDIDYGSQRRSRHTGVDIVAEKGSPVIAAADGKIILSGWRSSSGNRVMIYHGEENGRHFYTRYVHMDELDVKTGEGTFEFVERGQKIGTVGDTGSEMPRSRRAHLHYEVYALNHQLMDEKYDKPYKGGSLRFSLEDASDPHDYWLRDTISAPDKIIIPPFIKGREYPTKPIRFTYPVPCK